MTLVILLRLLVIPLFLGLVVFLRGWLSPLTRNQKDPQMVLLLQAPLMLLMLLLSLVLNAILPYPF